ncbi:MAG: IS66 family insertion sequence element accessory protein TnpB [Blastocatellales bacterium]|nr:IS66 family insertion sequence element accessory protein TnpB [Blastocatellales bacterium]
MVQHAQFRILLACEPVDFRKGDRLAPGAAAPDSTRTPSPGTVFVFRNRSGTAIKLFAYDGAGSRLCRKKFSKVSAGGPARPQLHCIRSAPQQLTVLLHLSDPTSARFSEPGAGQPDFKLSLKRFFVHTPAV